MSQPRGSHPVWGHTRAVAHRLWADAGIRGGLVLPDAGVCRCAAGQSHQDGQATALQRHASS
eukprot:1488711-Alexandrium_andersonii.AAC.1